MKRTWLRFFEVSLLPVCNRDVVLSIHEIAWYNSKATKSQHPISRSPEQFEQVEEALSIHVALCPPKVSEPQDLTCVQGRDYSPASSFTYYRDHMREHLLKFFENIKHFKIRKSGVIFMSIGSYCLVAKMCLTFCDPMGGVACQAPLSMRFPRENTGVDCHFLF